MPRAYQENRYAGILRVAIYLRKSRADEELERELGKGETLKRHRNALMRVVKENNLCLVKIYPELESGDSIIHRPQMLELLRDVEKGLYDAVLVMDIQRLGRGDQQDQGLIIKTFKESNTKIATPDRVYDLNDEYDEEYVENESFMGRKEYKYIKRRLQGGRIRSVQEGNYIGTVAPYGYVLHKVKRTRTLVPHSDQAPIVKMIFDLYTNKEKGFKAIANALNELGVPSATGIKWGGPQVGEIIRNEIYIGVVAWNKTKTTASKDSTRNSHERKRDRSEWILADGKHPPLVDEITFRRANEILGSKYHVPFQMERGIQNPLAGIVVCGKCGVKMQRRPYTNHGAGPHLICTNCDNKSSLLEHIEQKILQYLELHLSELTLSARPKPSENESASLMTLRKHIATLEKELTDLGNQKLKLHDLLEKEIYTIETFMERSKYIADKTEDIKNQIKTAQGEIQKEERIVKTKKNVIPNLRGVIDGYQKTNDPLMKNRLLRSVIEKVEYTKNKDQSNDDFFLKIYLKVLEMPGSNENVYNR